MNINLDLLLCLYGLGAAISFIIYIIHLHKRDEDVSVNTFELIFILLIVSAFWWLEVTCHIVMILYKWLCKPVINKRKLE